VLSGIGAAAAAPPDGALGPFGPARSAPAASAASAASATLHSELRIRGANVEPLVPGTAPTLSIQSLCQSRDPKGACIGTTTYEFDPKVIEVGAVSGEGADCTPVAGLHAVSCVVRQRVGESYILNVVVKIDPDARGETLIALSAVGSYRVKPDKLPIALNPRATLHVMQTPDPMLLINGARQPFTPTRVLVENAGPSAVHDLEVKETFSASPSLLLELDPDSRGACQGAGPLVCAFGRLGPRAVRRYGYSAMLSSQMPSTTSTATVTARGDVGLGPPVSFTFLHVGREYVGLLTYPSTIVRGASFTAQVQFFNLVPVGAANDVIPLAWQFDGGDELELVDYRSSEPLLSCVRGPGANLLRCATPDVSSAHSGGDATLTLRARRSGLVQGSLDWSTGLWGQYAHRYTLSVDEPGAR
jgi:hypothetical protein